MATPLTTDKTVRAPLYTYLINQHLALAKDNWRLTSTPSYPRHCVEVCGHIHAVAA